MERQRTEETRRKAKTGTKERKGNTSDRNVRKVHPPVKRTRKRGDYDTETGVFNLLNATHPLI